MWKAVLLALMLCNLPAQAQEARVRALADTVVVGERFGLAVVVEHPAGTTVAFPEVPTGDPLAEPLLQFGDAEVFSVRRFPPQVEGTLRRDSVVYEAATFALDVATLGPVPVEVIAEGDTTGVETGTAVLPVRSVLPAGAHDLQAPAPPEPFPSPWLAYALLLVGVLALLALLVWLWRRFRSPRTAPPRLAPYPEALARLDALTLPEAEAAVKPYYVALSDLLRRYLARTLRLPAFELTTRELVERLRTDPRLPDEAISAVRGTLRLADLVKFADLRPDAEAHAAAGTRAREAVEAVERAVHPPETEGMEGKERVEGMERTHEPPPPNSEPANS